jgi:Tfp pilus assembly protein PilF
MTEDKEKDLLEKISSCVEKGELEACVGEAIATAKELGISPQRLLELSVIQIDAKQYNQGYVLSLAAAEGLDEKAPAYNYAGMTSYFLNKFELSEKQFRLAIKVDPNYALAYFNLGVLLDELGRMDEAEKQYRLAIKSDPNDAVTYFNLGALLAKLGRKDEAENQYRLAIKFDPDEVAARNNYANLLREKGRFGEAENEIRIALDNDPFDPYSLGTLGDILADEGWLDESEREYKRALEHSDKMDNSAKSEIHNNLGWVYAQKKLYHNARDEFSKAKNIDQKNTKAVRNLRAVGRIETHSEITRDQIIISILPFLLLLLSLYLFWIAKLNETSFTALFMFFAATILFVLLYRSMGKFSVGPKGVEFEMSFEHRLAPAQAAEPITKIER